MTTPLVVLSDKDSWVGNDEIANTNFGSDTKLRATKDSTLSPVADDHTFIEFSLAGIPNDALITQATLRLVNTDTGGADPADLLARHVLAAWEESTITYANHPDDGGFYQTAATTVETWDLIDLVTAWHDGTINNYGLTIIRTHDSQSPTVWDSEDGGNAPRLEIEYSLAPYAPTLVSHDNFDANADSDFQWNYSDPDGDAQSAYQLQAWRVSDNTLAYDSTKVASSAKVHTIPAFTLSNGNEYQWRVKTWDAFDMESPWSNFDEFTCSSGPTVTITNPATDDELITESEFDLTWDYTDAEGDLQDSYRVVLTNVTTGDEVFNDVVESFATTYPISGLVDATSYSVEVTVWDENGMKGVPATRTFDTDLTPPPVPTFTVTEGDTYIELFISNPAPGGGETDTLFNRVLRRKVGDSDWTTIATRIGVDGSYRDYAVTSGQTYEYKIRAEGEGGKATNDSSITASSGVVLSEPWIHDPNDPAGTIRELQGNVARSDSKERQAALMYFAGRKLPVVEFGEQINEALKLKVRTDSDTFQSLRDLADGAVLCYRDTRGRKLFGVIPDLPSSDEVFGNETSFTFIAVDFDEGV